MEDIKEKSADEDIEQIKSSLKELETERDDIQLLCIKSELELSIENLLSRLKTAERMNDVLAEYIKTKNYADDFCEFRLDVKGRFHKYCYKGKCKECIKKWARKKVEENV